jgi:hypothetical protein
MNGETKPLESKKNCDVEKVPALIEEIKKEHGLAFDIEDTKKMSPIEVKRAYDQCAHWASNPKRIYPISRRVHGIFAGGEAGDLFGREIPAMIAHNSCSGDILFVLPHEVQEDKFSLEQFGRCGEVTSHPEAIISIYDFLKDLKQDLDIL